MAKPSKIEKYRLEQRCIALFRSARTTGDIAEILTAQLAEMEIDDTISQPTVSRWLKPYRDESKEETSQIITEHIKEQVKNDLAVVDEVEAWHLAQFRTPDPLPENPDHVNALTLRERSEIGMKVIRIIETKLRFALGGAGGDSRSVSPVDLEQFRCEVEELRGADD